MGNVKLTFLFDDINEDAKWTLRNKLIRTCNRVIMLTNKATKKVHISVIVREEKRDEIIRIVERMSRRQVLIIQH